MLSTKLIPFIPRPKRAGRLLPGSPIKVISVTTDAEPIEGWCYWDFGMSLDVTALPMGLCVYFNGEWVQPVDYGIDGRLVQTLYPITQSLRGLQWGIVTKPTGITEAARIVVPQGGEIG